MSTFVDTPLEVKVRASAAALGDAPNRIPLWGNTAQSGYPFFLPPLMFDDADQTEALALGARYVQGLGDAQLAQAAETTPAA